MARRIHLFAALALGITVTIPTAYGQEAAEPQQRLPSLSERLEQFRQELLGDPEQSEDAPVPQRPQTRPPRPGAPQQRAGAQPSKFGAQSNAAPQQKYAPQPKTVAQPKAMEPPQQKPAAVPSDSPANPAVTTPPRMEVQSARKAKAGGGLIPTRTPTETKPGDQVAEEASPVRPTMPEEPAAEAVPSQKHKSPSMSRSLAEELADDAPVQEPAGQPHVASVPSPTIPRELPGDQPNAAHDDEARHGDQSPAAETGVLFTTQSPVLSVEATGPRRVLIGKESQFTVKIRNAGAAANDVVVNVNIPEYVDVASAHASSGTVPAQQVQDQGALEWKITRLEANSSETLHLTLVPRKSTPLDLAVHFTFRPQASQTLVEVEEPKLEMMISGPEEVLYGETQVYKMTISNPGNGNSENVVIGLLPVGRGAEGISSHKIGTLRAGESKTIDVELTARQAGSITIKAQAYADGGLRTEAVEEVLVRRGALQIDVEAPKIKYAGTVGTYKVTVSNSGNAMADGVLVAAMLPADAKYIASNNGGRFEPQQSKVAWSAGNLQPGANRVFELQCSLGAPGDNRMQFVATANANLSVAATSNTQVEALADLKLEVRDPPGPMPTGQDTVFEVVVRNRGTKTAEGIDLTVFFSEGLEATSVEGGEHEISTGQVEFKTIPAVAAGEAATFKVHARAGQEGNHVFRAEVVCQSLNTRLAAEEATHFYGDVASAGEPSAEPEPTPASASEPTPAEPPASE